MCLHLMAVLRVWKKKEKKEEKSKKMSDLLKTHITHAIYFKSGL